MLHNLDEIVFADIDINLVHRQLMEVKEFYDTAKGTEFCTGRSHWTLYCQQRAHNVIEFIPFLDRYRRGLLLGKHVRDRLPPYHRIDNCKIKSKKIFTIQQIENLDQFISC